uniref:alpha/beta-hydrolase N-terminal domain-containing protein n=1 Tax=Nonomuraea sp. SBT364 TaxID=1580530 RepID=UPI00066BF5F9
MLVRVRGDAELWKLGFGGTLLGALFFCASLTPSLLPRTWLYQGVMGAVTAVLGYAVGASAATVWRAVGGLPPPGGGGAAAGGGNVAGVVPLGAPGPGGTPEQAAGPRGGPG